MKKHCVRLLVKVHGFITSKIATILTKTLAQTSTNLAFYITADCSVCQVKETTKKLSTIAPQSWNKLSTKAPQAWKTGL